MRTFPVTSKPHPHVVTLGLQHQFPNAWQPWTEKADKWLVKAFRDGVPVTDIASRLGRRASAIVQRLVNKGLMPDTPNTHLFATLLRQSDAAGHPLRFS